MKKAKSSIALASLTFLIAACSPGGSSQGSGGSTGSTGTGGDTGSGSGGDTGSGTGGDTGSGSGGSVGSGSGGDTGSGSGGDTGSGSGGDTGSGSGGSTGSGSGGATGTGSGGSSTGSGGAGTGSGGSSTGSGGSTGTGSGGTTGTGTGGSSTGSGGAGTGGAVVTLPTFVTSAPNAYWNTSGTLTTVTSNADMTVTDGTTYQTWDGFGGAFNEMGWDDLQQLSQTDRDKAIALLFGSDGARFIFGRIPIGASDYAIDRYTDNETANDYQMTSFSINRDKMRLIPFVKAALAQNPNLRLWGSPWTPPTWMKDNKAFDGGNMVDNAQNLQALALYLAKWVQAYAGESIKIEAIHPQNEPGYATGYPSCLWTAALYTKFVGQYLGPTFASQNVTAQIFLGTMSNNDSGKDGTIITTLNADSTAYKYIKGYGLQWNMLPVVSGLTSRNLSLMQTEHKCGNYPWETSTFKSDKAPNDHAYAIESWGYIRDWMKAGVNSYSTWNMVLDTIGNGIDSGRLWPQNALLTVDRSAKKLIITPVYYVFRHFSQFIAPGAKRVATSGSSVDALAFKNGDGSIVTVMYNSGSSAKTVTLSVGGTKVQFSVPGQGFATVLKR